MNKNLTLIHKRNLILYRLLLGYNLLNILISVFIQGFSVLLPLYWVSFFVIVGLLLWKQILIRSTMWFSIMVIFSYCYFLLNSEPNLVNLLLIWVGLVITTIYQNYRVSIFAGSLSIILTLYGFFQFHDEIFHGIELIDLSYLLILGLFTTIFLTFFTRFVSQMYVEANHSKEKVNFILDSPNVVTFSYDIDAEQLIVITGSDILPQLPTKYRSKSAVIWKHYAHSDDLVKLQQLDEQILTGKSSTVEYRIVFPSNKITWVQCKFFPVLKGPVVQKVEGILIDITERKQRDDEMKYLAYHDQLTGLPNRSKLQTDFTELLMTRQTPNLETLFLIFIDLDEFKTINDTYGHLIGDQLLKLVAKRLKNCIREKQIISRLSGDEFVAVISGASEDDIFKIATRIKTNLSTPYTIENFEISITTSIGIYKYKNEADDLNEMIKKADFAMYQVKKHGKNDFCFYEQEMSIK